MQIRNDQRRYGSLAQGLHWLIAALVIGMFGLGWYMTDLPLGMEKLKLYNLHKSIGITILVLMVLRLLWRLVSPAPPLPSTMTSLEQSAARASHALLYLLLIAQPLVGLAHSGAANFPVVVFGLVKLPALVAPDEAVKNVLQSVHFWISWVILAAVVLHISAALRHHFLLKDDILRRMLPGARAWIRRLLAIVPLVLGAGAAAAEEAPAWQVGPESRISFIARQSGAPVEGRFEAFSAEIRFDPENLDGSLVAVEIEVTSVDSESRDRDEIIRSPVLFDAAVWPTARFEARRFVANGGESYQARGKLTMRDVTREVVLPFTLAIRQDPEQPDSLRAVAIGELDVLRLDYGLGQGQWQDTSVVANEVAIRIEIHAQRPNS